MKRILGYTDRLTVRPGEPIEFKISAPDGERYRAQLVRLINGDTHSKAARFKEIEIASAIDGTYEGRSQSIVTGSCIVVGRTQSLIALDALTAALAFMPTTPHLGRQHLLSLWDPQVPAGWSLHLNRGRLYFTAVDHLGRVSTARVSHALQARRWYQAAVRVSWTLRELTLECIPLAQSGIEVASPTVRQSSSLQGGPPGVSAPLASLLIAAKCGGHTSVGRCIPMEGFNGRIEAPVIYEGLLTDLELSAVLGGDRPQALSRRLMGDWDFSLDIDGDSAIDRSGNGLHGRMHNLPLRGVKGSRWSGREMSWRHAREEYGAIHFHEDDLYDCGWETDIRYTIPENLPSGIYALRLRLADRSARRVEDQQEDYLTFFVATPRNKPTQALAFLVPTYTYLAYGNVRVWDSKRKESGLSKEEYYASSWTGPGDADYSVALSEHPDLGNSTYDQHLDGSPVHTSSWLRPLLNLRPKSVLWTFCADLLITDWLEQKRIGYDIITDDLLQQEGPSLLESYRVVMTGNHPEYQTTAQLQAIEKYLGGGGRLLYLGGNGFYWRCAVHSAVPGVIEVRRGRTGTGIWKSEVGEDYLAFTGELGGIWRDNGRPPQQLVGVGFIAEGHDEAYFRILPEARAGRAAFLLEGVEQDIIGHFGIFGTAVGQEIDKSNADRGTPPHAIVLARSEGHTAAMMYVIEEMNPVNPVLSAYASQTCAEIVFFETLGGGAVFSVGSMTWCGSLSHNAYANDVSRITENALRRFLDPAPIPWPLTQH